MVFLLANFFGMFLISVFMATINQVICKHTNLKEVKTWRNGMELLRGRPGWDEGQVLHQKAAGTAPIARVQGEFGHCCQTEEMNVGWSCVEPGVRFHDPCESLPSRDVLWLYDFIFSLYFFPKLSFYYFTQQQHLLKQLQQSANK